MIVVLALAMLWLWPMPAGPTVVTTGTSRYVVTATIDSRRVGTTAVQVDLAGRDNTTPTPAAVTVQTVLPGMGYATPPVNAVADPAGGYRAEGVPLMMIGRWELHISIRDAAGDDDLTVPVIATG